MADETIVVPGEGRVSVEPDQAAVRLGVSLVRPTAGEARESAAATMTSILAAVSAAGVERRDVRTAFVGLSPVTDYSSERGPHVTGYQLSNTIDVVVRDLPAVGALIDAALGAGATSLDGLELRVADPAAAESEARTLAVADARRRATTLAEAAGRPLGRVKSIVEAAPGRPFPPNPVAEMALKATIETPVAAGSQAIVVSVVVGFELG